jgi:hypothetical protein
MKFATLLILPIALSGCISFGSSAPDWDMQTTRPRDELAACVAQEVANGAPPVVNGEALVVTSAVSKDPPQYMFVSGTGVDGLPRALVTVTKKYSHPAEDQKVVSCLPNPTLPHGAVAGH